MCKMTTVLIYFSTQENYLKFKVTFLEQPAYPQIFQFLCKTEGKCHFYHKRNLKSENIMLLLIL